MTTKSINDRIGAGGLESVVVFRESNEIADGIYAPDSSIIKLPFLISQSFVPVTRTAQNSIVDPNDDTDLVAMATIAIRGGLMGINSRLLIEAHWDHSSPTGTKTYAYTLGGTNFASPGYTTQGSVWNVFDIFNTGSLTSQKYLNSTPQYGLSATAVHSTLSINTANNMTLLISCKWSGATPNTETITLLGYSVWHYPGND